MIVAERELNYDLACWMTELYGRWLWVALLSIVSSHRDNDSLPQQSAVGTYLGITVHVNNPTVPLFVGLFPPHLVSTDKKCGWIHDAATFLENSICTQHYVPETETNKNKDTFDTGIRGKWPEYPIGG